jgi:hypothetical protein
MRTVLFPPLARASLLCLAAAPLAAQVPAHATTLNPATLQGPPTLVQNGDFVHAFGNGYHVMHARSADGGRTWPLREQWLGTFAATWTALDAALLADARPGRLLVLGSDSNLGPRLARSLDDGTTWSPFVAVSAGVVPQAPGMRPALYVDGANVLVAWTNDRPNGRVFCNRSTDGGATWQPIDTRLDVGLPPSGTPIERVLIAGAGPVVHVVWQDGAIRRQRSLDGGQTWLPAAGGVTGVTGLSALAPYALVGDGTTLLLQVGWQLIRSADAGNTWALVTSHGIPTLEGVAMAGNLAVAAGRDWFPSTTYLHFASASTDGGATWRAPLALPAPGALAVHPHPFVDSGAVYVQWEIPGWPGNVIRSTDGGASWHAIEGPLHTRFSPGPTRTIHVAQAHPGSGRYHAYVGVGSTRLGASTAGTGGAAPRLTTVGLPVRGGATTLRVENALGGAAGLLAASVAPPIAVPLGSGTVHLASLDVAVGFLATGPGGQPGAGTFALPVAVPADPALVGASFVAQAVVLDPGAVAGFAVANAIELWLR